MASVMAVVALYLILYVSLSIPWVQQIVKDEAAHQLSDYLKTQVEIDRLRIYPFNRVTIEGVTINDQYGDFALKARKIGAGIDIVNLLIHRNLVFTHAELIAPDINIYQKTEDSPYNIGFLIDAFKPKEKNKPPTKFDFRINNIIIRQGHILFRRLWAPKGNNQDKIDFNHLEINDLMTDISLPKIKNDDFNINIRRLAFKESKGLDLNSLSGNFHISPQLISVSEFKLRFPGTRLAINNQELRVNGYSDIINAITHGDHHILISGAEITPSDFKSLLPQLSSFNSKVRLNADINGSIKHIDINELQLISQDKSLDVDIAGKINNIDTRSDLSVLLPKLFIHSNAATISSALDILHIPDNITAIIKRCGDIELAGKGSGTIRNLSFDGDMISGIGKIDIQADLNHPSESTFGINGRISTPGLKLGALLDNSKFGNIALTAESDLRINGKNIEGNLLTAISEFDFNGKKWTDINANLTKRSDNLSADFTLDDIDARISGNITGLISAKEHSMAANVDIGHLNFTPFQIKQLHGKSISGMVNADINGSDIDNMTGNVTLHDFILGQSEGRRLGIGDINIALAQEGVSRHISLTSDFIEGNINGNFRFKTIPATLLSIAHNAAPEYIPAPDASNSGDTMQFDFFIKENNTLTEYFNLPIRLLANIPIHGFIDGNSGKANVKIDCPYLQQGKDKLIKNTALNINMDRETDSYTLFGTSTIPGKNCDVDININTSALQNRIDTGIKWKFDRDKRFDGNILLSTLIKRNSAGKPNLDIDIMQSSFAVNDTIWDVHPAHIRISGNRIIADNILVNNNTQFVDINGAASASSADSLIVKLQNVDLDYVFETLNINYVTFGGRATGVITGRSLLSGNPVGETEWLKVDNLTYNGGRLGDAILSSVWNNEEKRVGIRADISDDGRRVAVVDGGIWVTRDSLAFGLDADKVNILFLRPFMSAFSSELIGKASGNARLYGTFSDIDLTGDLYADTIGMKVDYTNTWYFGSDSVIIRPGDIHIPDFRLYDKFGNSAILEGRVKHRFFHEPSFNFNISQARNLLCYDTNPKINPDWYGTIFGSGGGKISGRPGIVDILVEMTTAPRSTFTFVLSDTEAATDYKFLTFTDRRKEAIMSARPDTVPQAVRTFLNKMKKDELLSSSAFNIDLRTTITPEAQMILVMDPIAGDRIKANGSGALQIAYGSETDRMTMYGKYTLEKGNYNFSLQDIIIKDFTIRPGSTISFNGDPLNARLDIDAVYKINTSLVDLDKSFATDKDLNRTSVPVEAVLKVDGDLQSPGISFDIELPTLTQNVERKVKSIISTEDMMQRQIIYLLALNRFYSPEYMGGGSNNELSSIASSTISSQLSHIMSNLTDKWTISPYFHSDNGQFTDMEVDLALSSSLFNNRLLLNGNLGYRDKSTSSTTFIGDFDIEYLLNRRGSLRLKAYNHYNDKNYYLRSSLTTQGVGILYKHDFDRWFGFLRKWRKNKRANEDKDQKNRTSSGNSGNQSMKK